MRAEYLDRIKAFCDSCGISRRAAGCRAAVVGFSGGADSTLLLSVCKEILGVGTVAAAHLDHNLRGDEAKRDRDFCRSFCREHGVRLFEDSVDISAIAENSGQSTEEAGRNERYMLFDKYRKELASELSCTVDEILIATAHNADDNLETVIFNLARGSGLTGLCGIPPVRDGAIVRPLLCLSSREIRDICAADGIPYVNDSTNFEDGYTRNRIRHSVIPELEKINPAVARTACRTSASLREDSSFIDGAACGFLKDKKKVFVKELAALPVPVAKRVVSKMFYAAMGRDLEGCHIDMVLGAVSSGKHGRLHLPGNVTAYYSDVLEFVRETEKNENVEFRFDATPGEHVMAEYGFTVGFYPNGVKNGEDGSNIYKQLIYKICVNDKIKSDLFVRNRRDGDVILIGGHHKKLKKMMCDAGIPQRFRDKIPVVCDGEGVVWVPGFPARDGVAAKSGDKITVTIEYSKINEVET